MSRPLRFIPGKKTLVEVTTRTVHSRLLLRPSNELNEIVLGILGRAQELYGAQICGYSFLSNHYHILLVVGESMPCVPCSPASRWKAVGSIARKSTRPKESATIFGTPYDAFVAAFREAADQLRKEIEMRSSRKEAFHRRCRS
jgi:hypothetical protein